MKTILLTVSVFLSVSSFGQWKKVNNDHVDHCAAINSKICYAISYHNLLKTTDGGMLWDTVPGFSDSVYFLQMDFSSEKVGYVSVQEGSKLKLLKTEDGTSSFNAVNSNPFYYSQAIQLIDDKVGFFESGGFIHKTLDGGQSFSMFGPGQAPHFGSLHFLNEKEGFMGTSDAFPNGEYTKEQLLHTLDGGESWDIVHQDTTFFDTLPSREIELARGIYKINFTDKLHGFAASGNGTILNTIDGGLHWNLLGRLPDVLFCNDVVFEKNLKVGFVVAYTNRNVAFGVHSYVYKTIDGGKTWKQDLDLGTGPSLSFFSKIVDDVLYVTSFEGLYKLEGILSSIPKHSNETSFVIYPNPADKNGSISIAHIVNNGNNATDDFQVSLVDLSGRVLQEFKLNQQILSVPLNNASPGIYQLLIKEISTGNSTVQKLVIIN